MPITNHRSTRALMLAFAAALALGGCAGPASDSGAGDDTGAAPGSGSGSGSSSTSQPPLSGNWKLVGGSDADGDLAVTGSALTLDLQEEGRASGSGGCNTFSGEVTDDSGDGKVATLEFGPLLSTMMACADDAANTLERRYVAALGSATSYTLGGGRLVITGDGTELDFDEVSSEDE